MKIRVFSKIPRGVLRVAGPVILLASALFSIRSGSPVSAVAKHLEDLPPPSVKRRAASVVVPTAEEAGENAGALVSWSRAAAGEPDAAGLAIARRRGEIMRELVSKDPQAALDAMLPLDVYRDLPPEMRALIERPFAAAASLAVVPDCSSGKEEPDFLATWNGRTRRVFFPPQRSDVMSKDWISLSGVEIDGMAAIHPEPVWRIDAADVAAVADVLALECPLEPGPVTLVAGRLIAVAEDESMDLSRRLRDAERSVDPGARPVMSDGGNDEGEVTEALLRSLAKVDTGWSLSDKKVLFLNLRFADSASTALTKTALETLLAECDTRTREMSYGAVGFSSIVVSNELTLPGIKSAYNGIGDILYYQIYDEALALAVGAGLITDVSQSVWANEYDIIGVVFPFHSGAGWGGRASLGGRRHWINGNHSFETYIHEFGHNYGLNHASRWVESAPSEIPPTPPTTANLSTDTGVEPRHSEYGDWFDYMGGYGEFGVMGKNRLSWIDDGKIVDLTGNTMQDQTVRLYRFDEPGASSRPTLGARVQMQDSETFWLSYRGNHAQPAARQGAHIVWQFSSSRGRLLDMTPESGTTYENILPVGRSYTDPSGLVTLTPLAKGGAGGEEWLDVRVVTGVVGNNNPTLALSVDQPAAASLDVLTFTAGGNDIDGDPLFYNWDFGDGRTESVAGSGLTHSYQVGGTYTVTVSVLDGRGGYAEDSVQVVVADPLLQLAAVSSGISATIYDMAVHHGRLFAVSTYDLLASFDGLNWSEVPTPSSVGPHYGVHVHSGGIVLVGQDYLNGAWRGQIWESADGITWQAHDTPAGTGTLNSVCDGVGVLVAVGNGGAIMRKLPGGAWQSVSSGQSLDLTQVAYDGDRFWALGDDGLILVSDDSSTWSPTVSTPAGQSWSDFRTALPFAGRFFAGGDYGRLGVSPDGGDSWVASATTNTDLVGLAAIPQRVVCFGNYYNSVAAETRAEVMFVTTDGDKWSAADMPFPFRVRDSVFGAGRLVVAGDGGVVQASGTFFTGNQAPGGGLSLPATVQARRDIVPSGSITDPDGDPLCYYWNLGDGWVEGDAVPVFNFELGGSRTIELAVVDAKGGVFQQSFQVTVYDPLTDFSQVSVTGTDNFSDAICADGQLFAISWGKLHTGPVGGPLVETISISPFYPNDLATDGGTLVLVGQTYDFGTASWVGGISSSPVAAPVPLTKAAIPVDARYLNGVAFGNGNWVVVGNGGRILSKTGAGSWTERNSGVAVHLREVAHGGGVFMAVGDAGTVLVSADGATWTLVPGPGTQNLSDVDYCGNGFCVGGSDRAIHYTGNVGATWHTQSFLYFLYHTAVWTGGRIVVVGRLYDFDEAAWIPHLFTSADGIEWQYVRYDLLGGVQDFALCGDILVAVGDAGLLLKTDLSAAVAAESPKVLTAEVALPGSVRLVITSQPGQVFDVYRTADLSAGFGKTPYAGAVPASAGAATTEWTDSAPLPGRGFYQVRRR